MDDATTTILPGWPGTRCLRCDQVALIDERVCARCGATLATGYTAPSTPHSGTYGIGTVPQEIEAVVRFARPLWMVGLLLVLSFGLYLLPWSCRCWRFANAGWSLRGDPTRRRPRLRSLTLLIPLYSWFRGFYRLASDVSTAGDGEAVASPGVLTTVCAISVISIRVLHGGLGLLVYLGGMLFCTLAVQAQINRSCELLVPGVTAKARLGWQAVVGIVIGVLLWLMLVLVLVLVLGGRLQRGTSTGVATLQFGQGIDTATYLVTPATNTFHLGDQIVWSADLNGRLGTTSVQRTVDREANGALLRLRTDQLTVHNPNITILYERSSIATLTAEGLVPGTYMVRFWRDTTVIAQGTFTMTN